MHLNFINQIPVRLFWLALFLLDIQTTFEFDRDYFEIIKKKPQIFAVLKMDFASELFISTSLSEQSEVGYLSVTFTSPNFLLSFEAELPTQSSPLRVLLCMSEAHMKGSQCAKPDRLKK